MLNINTELNFKCSFIMLKTKFISINLELDSSTESKSVHTDLAILLQDGHTLMILWVYHLWTAKIQETTR